MSNDLNNLFNSLELLLFVLDVEGNIIYCNDTACNRLGYTRQELIGMPVVNLHPLEKRMFAAMLVDDLLKGDEKVCPIPIKCKDSSLIQVETRVSRGFWKGKPALFGVTKDITELKLSNEKFSTIFQFAPIPIAITSVKEGKIFEVNDAWVELTGYSRQEAVGKTIYDLKLYRTDEERDELITELKKVGVLHNHNVIMQGKGDKLIIGQFSAARILINGIDCWITALVDQTNQTKLKDAIIKFKETVIKEARDNIVQSLKDGTFVR